MPDGRRAILPLSLTSRRTQKGRTRPMTLKLQWIQRPQRQRPLVLALRRRTVSRQSTLLHFRMIPETSQTHQLQMPPHRPQISRELAVQNQILSPGTAAEISTPSRRTTGSLASSLGTSDQVNRPRRRCPCSLCRVMLLVMGPRAYDTETTCFEMCFRVPLSLQSIRAFRYRFQSGRPHSPITISHTCTLDLLFTVPSSSQIPHAATSLTTPSPLLGPHMRRGPKLPDGEATRHIGTRIPSEPSLRVAQEKRILIYDLCSGLGLSTALRDGCLGVHRGCSDDGSRGD